MILIETCTNSAADLRRVVKQLQDKGFKIFQIVPYSTYTAVLYEGKETVSSDNDKLTGRA